MSQPPSFTSFPRSQPSTSHQQQPSFASFPGPNSSSRPRKHKSHEQLVDESSRKKRKHQHQHQHHSAKDRSSSNKTSPAQVKRHEALALQLTVYPRRSSATSTQSIISDTAGDPDFSRYGSLQTSQVPKFRRAGAGRVLGASTGLRIIKSERASRKTLTLLPPNQAHLSRYIDRRNVSKLLDKKRKLYQLLPGQDTSKGKPYAPFIALLEEDMPPEIDSLDEPEYRHTEAPPSASGSDSGSEVDNDRPSILGRGVSYLDKLTSRNAELSAATRERPYDIHAWLDFVAHQDVFLSNTRADFDTQPEGANRSARRIHKERVERRAISETKLDILDKALKLNRSATQLVRERLKIGEDIWTVDELGKEWERSLRKTTMDEENNALWMHWFEWKARDARGFTIRDVLQPAAQEALQNLRSFDHQLHVFDKTMRALRAAGRLSQLSALIPRADDSHAGYRERANATYQALMELNFFCPEKLKLSSLDEQMKELNMHWDSEKLRFGEAGAKGWAHTADDEIPPELSHQPIIDVSNSLPPENESVDGYERWAAQETIAMASRHYSVRTEELDDEKDDDTFRAVSFEKDIQPYLFIITATSTDPKRHVQSLIFSYLSFHGLELLQPGHSTNDSQPPDDLLSPLAMNHFFPSPVPTLSFEVVGGEPMEAARRSGLKSPADGWGRHWPVLQEMLFASEDAGWPSFWSGQDWKRFDCVAMRYVWRSPTKLFLQANRLSEHLWSSSSLQLLTTASRVY